MSSCPFAKSADESACPFGTSPGRTHEAPNSSLGEEMSKCSTYQSGGCPIDNKAKDDIEDLLSVQAQRSLSLNGKVLERFIPEAYPNKLEPAVQEPILDDPHLAAAMRQGTKAVHAMAEKSVFTKRFLKGDISKSEYGQYIRSLYFIYRAMENLLEQHQDHPAIEMIYFPEDLNREQALLDDLAYFYGPDLVPMLTDPMTMTPAVKQYVHALESACLVDPSLLVSHSYTRYLGDLSGGQILAKRLKKHILQLKKSDSSWHAQEGVSFYYFNTIGNTNEFKNMYRQQLDQVPVTESLKASIVEESIRCFELNIALFDEIQALSEANSLVQLDQVQAIPPPEPSPTASQKRDLPTLSTLSPATTILTSMVILIGCGFYMRQRS